MFSDVALYSVFLITQCISLGIFLRILFRGLKSASAKKITSPDHLVMKCKLVTNDSPCVSGSVAEWSKALV